MIFLRFLPGLAAATFPALEDPATVPSPKMEGTIDAVRLTTDKSF